MKRWAIGIDLGGTNVRVAAVDAEGNVGEAVTEALDRDATAERPFAQIVRLVRHVVAAEPGSPPVGVGVGATGPLDPRTGVIDNPHTLPPNMCGDIVTTVGQEVGIPVVLENDADVAALAEATFGAGRNQPVVACVTVGTGVGVGVVRDDQLLRGAYGTHPEAGHLVVDPAGPACYCGVTGCVESLASATAVLRAARDAGVVDSKGTARDVFVAAEDGDRRAQAIVVRAHTALALLARNLVATHATGLVVFAGNALGLRSQLLSTVRAQVDRFPFGPAQGVTVTVSALGPWAGCIGAARLVLAP
jgi:glucokinase